MTFYIAYKNLKIFKVTFHFIWNFTLFFFYPFLCEIILHVIYDDNKGNRVWNTRPKIFLLSFREIKCKRCIVARSSMLYMSVALLMCRVRRFEGIWPPDESNNLILCGNHRVVSNQMLSRIRKALREWSEGELHSFSLQKTRVRSCE